MISINIDCWSYGSQFSDCKIHTRFTICSFGMWVLNNIRTHCRICIRIFLYFERSQDTICRDPFFNMISDKWPPPFAIVKHVLIAEFFMFSVMSYDRISGVRSEQSASHCLPQPAPANMATQFRIDVDEGANRELVANPPRVGRGHMWMVLFSLWTNVLYNYISHGQSQSKGWRE